MHLFEILTKNTRSREGGKILNEIDSVASTEQEVRQSMYSWFCLEAEPKDIEVILRFPETQNFKSSSAKVIYRCIVLSKTGNPKGIKSNKKFITYSEDPDIPHRFFHSLDITNDYLIIKKIFHQNDLILNFSALANSLGESGGWDEKELWMKPTVYYRTIEHDEIVYDSRTTNKT